jgi:putative DNA methylase
LSTIASDLNPVAVILSKAASEIPSIFKDALPVNASPKRIAYTGTQGLAEDIEYYGNWMRNKAKEKIQHLYPKKDGKNVLAWLWTRTTECPNPACKCKIPLSSTFLLNTKKGQEAWVEPVVTDGKVHFQVHNGICPENKETNKFSSYGAKFRCPLCGEVTTDEYVKEQGRNHAIGSQMVALLVEDESGKLFAEVDVVQEAAADISMPDDLPVGSIPDNAHWFSPPGFGFTEYSDLFTARQMTMLLTFSDLLKEVQDKVATDALAAGFSPTGGDISKDGHGALAYGQAVSIYLSLLVDMLADHHSTICSLNNTGGNIRNTFRRQAIPMTWNFAEGNPFADISGNFNMLLDKLVSAVKSLPCDGTGKVVHGNALDMEYPKNVMICTELPYYKNIGYAHLSDFFYIWMRRNLKDIYPELFNQTVTSKEELSTVSEYYGVPREEAREKYEEELAVLCKKLMDCASTEFPALLFFEYHRDDEKVILKDDLEPVHLSPWENIVKCLIGAGFSITATLPIRDKKVAENASSIKVLIVCRKTEEKTQVSTRRGFVASFKKEFPELLDSVLVGADQQDCKFLAMGCGLSVYSRYKRIVNADGSEMDIHNILQIIRQETDEYLAQKFEKSGNVDELPKEE